MAPSIAMMPLFIEFGHCSITSAVVFAAPLKWLLLGRCPLSPCPRCFDAKCDPTKSSNGYFLASPFGFVPCHSSCLHALQSWSATAE
uniref:Secreted protein n=1 Tax=Panagrellus redivivus TaxID=6233 RepID=A0A7E4VM96_PANRE